MNTKYSVLKPEDLDEGINSLRDGMHGVMAQMQVAWMYPLILLTIIQKYGDEVEVTEDELFYPVDALSVLRFLDNHHYDSDTFMQLHMYYVQYNNLGRNYSMDLYKELVIQRCNQLNKFAAFCGLDFKF